MRLTSPFSRMPAPSFRGGASRRYKCCAPRSRIRGANCRGVLSVRFCTVTVETPTLNLVAEVAPVSRAAWRFI